MENIISLKETTDIKKVLYLFKNDLSSLRDGRVEIDIYAEKIHQHGYVGVYMHGSEIKGFVAFYANDKIEKKAYLSMIAVKEEYRREKIGSKMIAFVEKETARKGMITLNLEVNKKNHLAINFYEGRGYRTFEETENSFYMCKEVENYGE